MKKIIQQSKGQETKEGIFLKRASFLHIDADDILGWTVNADNSLLRSRTALSFVECLAEFLTSLC